MSFGIEPKKLKTLIDLYHPKNHGEQIKYMVYLRGEQELFINLQTSPFQGVSENSLEDRESVFGKNEILPRKQSLLNIFLTSLNSPLIYFPFTFSLALLIYRSVKQGPQPKVYEPLILMMTAIVNWLLRSSEQLYFYIKWYNQDHQTPEQFCTVIRQNKRTKLLSKEISVGDLIQFQEGDIIPADGWLIEGSDVTVFQRYLSQSIEVQKDSLKRCIAHMKINMQRKQLSSINDIISEKSPVLISGSVVKTGQGRMIVLSVGKLSKRGQFQWLSRERIGENIIKNKLEEINGQIYKYLFIFALLYLITFSEMVIQHLSSIGIYSNIFSFGQWENVQISLLIIIFGLPQGFYFSYFIGLICFKIRLRLSEDIRVNYCEHLTKMASVTEICYNRQKNWGKVHYSEWWNEQKYEFHKQFSQQTEKERDLTEQSSIEAGDFSEKFGDLMQKSLKLKNSEEPGQPYFISPVSILVRNSINDFQIFKEVLEDQEIYYISDSNSVKFVFMIFQSSEKRGEYYLIVKGKSSSILNICKSMIMKSTDDIQQLRQTLLQRIGLVTQSMSKRLITTHGLCFKTIPNNQIQTVIEVLSQKNLTLLCLLGVNSNKDHSQYEIVRKIKQAAINLVLVSSKSSTQSITRSRSIGINTIDEQNLALQGKQFLKIVGGIICFNCKKSICMCQKQVSFSPRLKNLEQFKRITRYFKVMSTATYYEKYSLMIGYRNINRFSVFMGIEDEDHPALSNSYLSITSVDSSQELVHSEVYFPNNSLKSLYKFIKWSRHSFQFVRKLLQLFLPASIVAIGVMIVSGLFFKINPFNITQLIWATLFSCGMIAINLSLQKPQQSQMDQKTQYYGQSTPFIVQTVKKQIVSQSISQSVLLIILLICGHLFIPQSQDSVDALIGGNYKAKYFDQHKNTVASGLYENPLININSYKGTLQAYGIYSRHLTIIYNIYAIMQILNYFNCRKIGSKQINVLQGIGIHNIIIFGLTLGSHILFVQLAGPTAHFYNEGLSIEQWLFCIGLSLIVIFVGFVVRLLPDPLEETKNRKRWPNKSYNLSVKLVGKSDKFFEFDREEDLQFKPQ